MQKGELLLTAQTSMLLDSGLEGLELKLRLGSNVDP